MKSLFLSVTLLLALTLVSLPSFSQGLKDTLIQLKGVNIITEKVPAKIPFCGVEHVTVYDLLDFHASQGKRLSDVMGEFTPLFIKSYGVGQLSSTSINGSSAAQTDILWNGIKINSPTTGQADLSLFDVGTVDNINVSTFGGRNAVGGSINLDNELLSEDTFRSNNVMRYGSFNALNISSNNRYRFGAFSGSTRVTYISSDNDFSFKNTTKIGAPIQQQVNAATQQLSFLQQLNYSFKKNYNVGFNFWLTDADRQLPPVMTQEASAERQYDQSYRSMAYINGKVRHFDFSFKTAYIYDRLRYTDPAASIDSRSDAQAFRNSFDAAFQIKDKLTLNIKPTYDYERAVSTGFDSPKQRNTLGLGIHGIYDYSRSGSVVVSLTQAMSEGRALPFAPALTWHQRLRKGNHMVTLSAGLMRAYRLPSLNDLYWSAGGNPDLRTEQSWKSDMGLRYNYKSLIRFYAGSFASYVTDWILWHPNSSGLWTPDNVKRVLSRGVNIHLNIESRITPDSKKLLVSGYLGYSYTKATSLDAVTINDNSAGKQLIYVPVHVVSATLQLKHRNFYIRSINSYTGERYTTTDNSQSLDGYYLTHIEIGKDFHFQKQVIGLSFRVNNLTNNQYQVVELRPMPGRSYEATIKMNLVR
jgi:iron complex outermembrane receptor protein